MRGALLPVLVGVCFLGSTAMADAPLVYGVGSACGGHGPRGYAYEADAASYPMLEFTVGTNDLDPAHYANVLIPPGWDFAVEPVGMSHAHGVHTPHGEVSPGPCYCLTAGRVRWWTDDEAYAVEWFTFGFDHRWVPEDVGWVLSCYREGPPPEYYTFAESWDDPVGMGTGPLHGPFEVGIRLNLGPEELVQASGVDIDVPGYSVPSFTHWDGDNLEDLIVGEGSGSYPGKVRVYLNVGSASNPAFSEYFYAQSNEGDLAVPGGGCMGAFPRVVYWDADGRKDLLVGQADGMLRLFLNVGTDNDPVFDEGTLLQVGEPAFKTNIDVGSRATSTVADWNADGKKDLVVGALDGKIHVFLNEGTDTEPDFRSELLAQANGVDLVVPAFRSSPVFRDLDNDGKKDLLTGDTSGQLLLYSNTGSNQEPSFSGYTLVEADGVPIDLPGTPRSRPYVCDWTGDGLLDVLIGAGDGVVRLYQGRLPLGDLNCDGVLDASDIDPFVLALTDPAGYAAAWPDCDRMLADCNGDGEVDAFDIDPFVELLIGG